MQRWEGLGYDPGPVGESHTRVGPPTRETAAAPAGAHTAPARQASWPGTRTAAPPHREENP
ncbi:hypothetical protein J2Z79_002642 [Symbiobacterium terraclitae]|uniref:Uncharacterized protein n=1 Tax=Symbiobacterium terraclitae TaxID=557451 RepID=A0ABS4JUJ7_9FIRM|nr:hypothetical protein [Symbiobacterium terraclitae]MBP2019217.1 hypothetical protein [Symbiobacterium terraclitae]